MMSKRLENLIYKKISRRKLLKNAAAGVASYAVIFNLPDEFLNLFTASKSSVKSDEIFFRPIEPSSADELVLPEGYSYDIIRKWGDKISENEYYGYNNDYCVYIPIDLHNGGKSSDDGILFINHEYPHPLFVSGYSYEDMKNNVRKSKLQVELEMKSMGVSIFRVRKEKGSWKFVNDRLNRRYDGTSEILISGPAAGTDEMKYAYKSKGTVQNCSGGITPWGTVLSAEENYQDCLDPKELRWGDVLKDFTEEHYGWMVEFDPFDPGYTPKKRTALGRFRHENIAMIKSQDGRLVCYMGDDKVNEHVYKFVTEEKFDSKNPDKDILDHGKLYVADFEKGKWLLLDYETSNPLKMHFRSQADVLVNCPEAAKLLGATECNRPEDIEISPVDGSVFIAFTNNYKKDDHHGSIVRIIEENEEHTSEKFRWEVYATGGDESGFSCPDNLHFDSKGNLWILSDIGSSSLNKGIYRSFKNNSLFMIPTQGTMRGKVY
ncbi:MAG: DUF839 domain-containing protein, partial [Ignavibacteria bacterium]|nr:DUF839 domain-containing protein [Ignavibacteria bacterium]